MPEDEPEEIRHAVDELLFGLVLDPASRREKYARPQRAEQQTRKKLRKLLKHKPDELREKLKERDAEFSRRVNELIDETLDRDRE